MSSSATSSTTSLTDIEFVSTPKTPLEIKRAALRDLKAQTAPERKTQPNARDRYEAKISDLEKEIKALEKKAGIQQRVVSRQPTGTMSVDEELAREFAGLSLKEAEDERRKSEFARRLQKDQTEAAALEKRLNALGVTPKSESGQDWVRYVASLRVQLASAEAAEKERTSGGGGGGGTSTSLVYPGSIQELNAKLAAANNQINKLIETELRLTTEKNQSNDDFVAQLKESQAATDRERQKYIDLLASKADVTSKQVVDGLQKQLQDCQLREDKLTRQLNMAEATGKTSAGNLEQMRAQLLDVTSKRAGFEHDLVAERAKLAQANADKGRLDEQIATAKQTLDACRKKEQALEGQLAAARQQSSSSSSSSSSSVGDLANLRTSLDTAVKERDFFKQELTKRGVDRGTLRQESKEISKIEHEGTFVVVLGSSKAAIYASTVADERLLPLEYFTRIVGFASTEMEISKDANAVFALKLPRSGSKFTKKMEQLLAPYLLYVYTNGETPVTAWANTIVPVLELIIDALQKLYVLDTKNQVVELLVDYMHDLVAWLFVRLSTGRESGRQAPALTEARLQNDETRNNLAKYPFTHLEDLRARFPLSNVSKGNNLIGGGQKSVPTTPLFAMYNAETDFAEKKEIVKEMAEMTVEAIVGTKATEGNKFVSTMIERAFMINLFRRFSDANLMPALTAASWAKGGVTITRKLAPGVFTDEAGKVFIDNVPTGYAKIVEKLGVDLTGAKAVDLKLTELKKGRMRTRITGQLAEEFLYVLKNANETFTETDINSTRRLVNTLVAGVMFTPVSLDATDPVPAVLEDATLVARYGMRPVMHDKVGDQVVDYIIRTAGRPTSSAAMTTHADAFSFKTLTDIGRNKLSEAIKNPKNNKNAPAQSKWIDAANTPQTGLSGGVTVFDELDDQTLGPFTVLVADNVYWNDAQRKGLFKGHGNPGQIAAYHALRGTIDLDTLPVAYKEYQTLEGSDIQLHAGGSSPAGRTLIYINYDGTSHPVEIGPRSKQTKNGYWYELFAVVIPPATEGIARVARAALPDPLSGQMATQYQAIPRNPQQTTNTYGQMTGDHFLAGLDHLLAEQMATTVASSACIVKVAPPGTPRPDLALLTETNRADDLLALAAKSPLLVFLPSPQVIARFRDVETRVQRRTSVDIVAALRAAILYHVVPLTPDAIPTLAERNKDSYALKTASGETLSLLSGTAVEALVVRENLGVVYCDELLATGLVLGDRAKSAIFTYRIERLLNAGPPLLGATMPERKRALARVNSLLATAQLGDALIEQAQRVWLVLFLPTDAALAAARGITSAQLADALRYHIVILDEFTAAEVACFTRQQSFTMETAARKPLVYECKATTATAGRVYKDELNYIGHFAVRNAPNGLVVVEVDRVLQPFATLPAILPPPLVAPGGGGGGAIVVVPPVVLPLPPIVPVPVTVLPPPPPVIEGEALRLMTQQAHAEAVKVLGSKDKRASADAIGELTKKIEAQGGARQLKRAGMTVGQWTDMHQQRVTALMRNGALDSVDKSELADALNALSDRF